MLITTGCLFKRFVLSLSARRDFGDIKNNKTVEKGYWIFCSLHFSLLLIFKTFFPLINM
jgi:hypothetical protein